MKKDYITHTVIIVVAALLIAPFVLPYGNHALGQLSIFDSAQVGADPDNGDCLTTDGTNSTWSTCASGGGGGDSAWTIGSGVIFNATSTDYVGIGTSTPSELLEVAGNIDITSSFPILNLMEGDVADNNFRLFVNGGKFSLQEVNDAKTVATDRFTIDTSGNVGIGTTGPGSLLDVRGTTQTIDVTSGTDPSATLNLQNNSATIGTGPAISFTSYYSGTSNVALGTLQALREVGSGVGADRANASLVFSTNNSTVLAERMRITSTGNVGIGTTTPSSKLDVYSSGQAVVEIDGGSTSSEVSFRESGTEAWRTGYDFANNWFFVRDQVSGTNPFIIKDTASSNSLVISTAGNVGIGTTSPESLLHVQKDHNGATSIQVGNYNGGGATQSSMSLANGPGALDKLTMGTLGTSYSTSGAYIQDAAYIGANSGLSGGLSILTGASAPIRFYTGGTGDANERLRITSTGNVGIGTITPLSVLQVNSSSTTFGKNLRLFNTNDTVGAGPSILFHADVTTSQLMAKGGIAYARTTTYGRGDIHFLQDATAAYGDADIDDSVMVIKNSGNVGIGTTNPSNKLQVSGGWIQTDTAYGLKFGGDNNLIWGSNTNNYISIDTNGQQRIRVDSSGNVGIGTTSPGARLTVGNGTGNEEIRIDKGASSVATLGFYVAGSGSAPAGYIQYDAFENLHDRANGYRSFLTGGDNERMRITSTGNVGIGTTSPSTKLHVDGGIRFEDLVSCDSIDTDASGVLSCGTDATGGSGVLSTTTPWTAGQLAVVVDESTINSIATSTLSEDITGLEFDAAPWIIGTGRTLSLSSGYVIPLSASTTNWNTFYDTPSNRITAGTNIDWTGNTLNVDTDLANYSNTNTAFIDLTDLSSTATGLTYTSGTGVFSLAANYVIPLSASTTEWSTAFGWGNHASAGYITGVAWGDITGTLSSQTDLQAALDAKLSTTTAASTYQPLDSDLTAIAALANTDSNIIVGNGSTWVAESGATARTSLGLTIGTNVQAYDADLTTYAGITPSANVQSLLGAADFAAFVALIESAIETALDTLSNLVTVAISTTLQIPFGTTCDSNTDGELCHDTSDNQWIGDGAVIGKATDTIFKVTVASTSPAFTNGALLKVPTELDGFTVTNIRCSVQGGTSKVVAIEDESANSSEDITCGTSVTSDDGTITNATYTAGEEIYIDFGATTGSVDYVSISVFGTWTRE